MTTDFLSYTTTPGIDARTAQAMQHLFPAELRKAIQDRSIEQNLQPELVCTLIVLLALKNCLDLPDQEVVEQIDIFSKSDRCTVAPEPIGENAGLERSFLDRCADLHHALAREAGIDTARANSKFLVVLRDDAAGFDIPEHTAAILVTITLADTLHIDWRIAPGFLSEDRLGLLAAIQDRLLDWVSKEDWARPLPDLLDAAQRAVRDEVNRTATAIEPQPIHAAFFRHALAHPSAIALYREDGTSREVSYGELAKQALQLSRTLADHGAVPGSRAAIILPKGSAQVTAVMGILGCGALYIPVGVEQPLARQEKIFTKAGVQFMVTDTATLAECPHLRDITSKYAIALINLDELSATPPLESPVNTRVDQLAYIIFTSGSTGEPKGVEITHAAAWNTIQDINTKFEINASDRALALSALDFDLSVYDIFGLLAVGGSLVLIREEDRKEAARWLLQVEQYKVTVWNSVPALLDMLLLRARPENDLSSLRLALVSGDWVGLDLKDRMKESAPDCRLIALGGATEAAIWSNFFPVNEVGQNWKSIPYGKPLANQKYRVVNSLGMDCPDGVTGELWIGGKGVAAGYTNNKDLTDSRFVTAHGERWYRTGDLGRYWSDGNLEFLGRIDHQVKVNGFRIELGEIEAALKTFPGVAQATAAVLSINQSAHLVAGIVGEKNHTTGIAEEELSPTADPAIRAAYATQKQVVANFLYELLDLPAYTGQNTVNASGNASLAVLLPQLRAQLVNAMDIARENTAILDMWLHWLQAEDILTAHDGLLLWTDGAHVIGERDAFLHAFSAKLDARKSLLRQVLDNAVPALSLLDDELLSPEILSTQDKGTIDGIERIAEKINHFVGQSERTIRVAILGGRTGMLTEKLLQATPGNKIEYSVIDEGRAMVRSFTERLSEAGYKVNGVELKHNQVPEAYLYHFDFVVAINTLHRFPEPGQGVFISNLLTQNGGRLLALEASLLMPVALLSSGVIDLGFQYFDAPRSAVFSPMLGKTSWKNYLREAGFTRLQAEDIPGTAAVLYEASCPEARYPLKESEVLAHIRALLPPHMMPDRVAILPRMPLSANGKVDRKSFAALVRTMVEADVRKSTEDFEQPVGEMEESIAALWKNLLALEAVGRNDVFFEIGGDSLSATRLLTEIRKQFEVHLSLRELFGATLKDVAAKVEAACAQLQQELETMETGEI